MKKDIKKPSKAVEVEVLSTAQSEYLDNFVSYQLQVIEMDNIYNKDRATLVKLAVENIALALGTKPSYALWNSVHDYTRQGVCDATGMEFESFDKNIWNNIVKRLESDYELVKPSSPNKKSEQKSEQRAKIDALTDAELKEQGKLVELAKREEKRLKEENSLIAKAQKDFVKNFSEKMKNLAKNELDFAMFLDANLNSYREQFKKQS